MELHIKIIGCIFLLLAILHIVFPAYFRWKTELTLLSLINRQMMQVHTFFIALTVLLMGLLCISSAHELVSTPLGKRITAGLFVFWCFRLLFQFFVYSPELWRDKRKETMIHLLFSVLWGYVCTVFFITLYCNQY